MFLADKYGGLDTPEKRALAGKVWKGDSFAEFVSKTQSFTLYPSVSYDIVQVGSGSASGLGSGPLCGLLSG